jgi:outer membrane protein assembly factor BamB
MNFKNKINLSKEQVIALLKGVAWTAAGFTLILCILLLANYIQIKSVDPLNNPSLTTLMEHLEENPQDEALKQQIRALDLLARKAFFTSQWQLRTGGLLLLAGVAILLSTLRGIYNMRKTLPMPEGCPDADITWFEKIRARKGIVFAGSLLLTTSLVAAILSYSDISRIDFSNPEIGSVSLEPNEIWANFRGPGGNGIAIIEKAPVEWDGDSGSNVKWKVEVPLPGFSSPIVWGDKVFITGANRQTQEIFCYEAESGKILWRHEVKDIEGHSDKDPNPHNDTGYAPSTMATDGRFVCSIFPTADLICLDMKGNRIWAQNLGLPDNHYGHSSSLLVFENLLIIQYDQNRNSRLLAVEISSGETVWRVNRSVISWSSPICVNTGERMELILTNSTSVDAFDPRTGVKLWGHNVMGGEMGPSAAFADGWVFAANDYAVVAGIQLSGKDSEVVWEYDENMPDTASPLATNKYLFLACSYGYIICLNAKTGEFLWEQEFDDGFYASPILVGDKVYAMDLQGAMHIFKADNHYKSIGDPHIGEPSACTPAFVKNRIFIRGDRHLFCIENL